MPTSLDPAGPAVHSALFVGRWQPHGLLLKAAANAQDDPLSKRFGEQLVANLGDRYWILDRTGLASVWQDHIDAPSDVRTPPAMFFNTTAGELAMVLNMGVMHIQPGCIKWKGNDFSAGGYVPEQKASIEVTGKVVPTRDLHAKEIRVQYRSSVGLYNYDIEYRYTTNTGLSYLPNIIRSFFVAQDHKVLLAQWDIESIQIAAHAMPASFFNLEPLVRNSHLRVRYFTNHAWYAKNALGKLVPIQSTLSQLKSSVQELSNHNLYYAAVMAATLLAFALAYRANLQQRNSQQKDPL
jgi:hypothetical protein